MPFSKSGRTRQGDQSGCSNPILPIKRIPKRENYAFEPITSQIFPEHGKADLHEDAPKGADGRRGGRGLMGHNRMDRRGFVKIACQTPLPSGFFRAI